MSKKKNTAGKSGDVTQKLFVEAGTGIGHEKDGQRRCLGCMELYSEEYEICPYCGYTIEEEVENALHMFPGTVLYDKYIIGRVIGYGGFGVTYLAWDTVLQIKVAIKEYLPSEFSTRAAGQTQVTVFSGDKSKQFSDGMEKFIDEAKRLAKFRSENGIVKIFDSFSENGTAYIAMEYLQGETLAERLERDKTIPVEESIQMLMPIIESLNRVHDEGIIHRDIAPDNIFLTNKGEVKLIDFGASRYATTSRSRSLTVIIKPGYSAEEQYRSRGDQGSHTDVYSVGAVLYRMVTGQAPPDAMERRALFEKNGRDMLIPIKKFDKNIDQRRENAIYNSLNIRIEDRTPDMISLAGELLSEEPVKKRRSGIKKIDPLTWPLWAKIGIPSGLVAVVTLCVLLAFGVIGPKSGLETDFIVPEGQVLIPNIVAESVEDAQETLREESLTPKIHDKIESAIIDRNLVLRQDPDALNVVNKGSIVNIIISDGRGMALIPDVVGMSLEFATQQLEERGFVVATEEEASEIIAQGAVISMDFEPNTDVEKGTTVTLKISTGPENIDRTKQVKVPKIVGLDYEQAKKVLAKYKLMAAIDDETYNSSIPENQVVGQLPYENANAFQGDTVYVTVNRKQKMVDIVNYVGKPFDDVAWELREKGLVVEAKYVQNKDYSEGRICAQNIENKSVPVGTKIVFSVSEGYLVQVPDVKGEKQNQAEKILTDLGLEVNSVVEYSDTVGKGKVIRNDLVGEKVEQGTLVTIVVSEGKKPDDAEDEEPTWQQQTIGLTSINIATKPTRTEYYVGDKFNSSGISVVANYSDSSNKNITSQCRFTGTEFNYKGSATVTVTYEEGGITKTASFNVKVLEPEISISESNIVVTEGGSASLSCTTKPSGQSVTWSVDNSSVATVSNGSVKGVSKGRATVWATLNYNGKQYTSNKVTVTVDKSENIINPTVLTISDGENIKIQKGNEKDLDATFNEKVPEDKKGIKWTSSDSSVVQVKNASTGVIYGIKPGKATITATSTEYGIKDTCVVEVCEPEVRSIEVTKYPEYIYQGETIDRSKVEVVITYVLGDTKRVTLSDNADIKMTHDKLDNNGTKTVTISYGGKTATFKINVQDARISIIDKNSHNKLEINGSVQLKLDYSPKGIGSTVKWSVNPSGIVTVDNNGVVTAKKAGTATVTVTGSHNGKTLSDSVEITVSGNDSITGIEIEKNPGKNSTYYVGDSYSTKDMKINLIKASGASEEVSSGFSVTPEKFTKAGLQTMTVRYGSFTATFNVDVKTPGVSISQSDFTLDKGKTKSIQASPKPDKEFEIVWESSAPGIAKVEADSSSSGKMNAVVTAVEGGEATITARIKYKGTVYGSDSIKVTVKAEKVLSSIQVSGTPTNQNQYIGDDFDPTGLTVKAVYSDGTSQNVTGFDCTQSNITQATQDITISYGGQKATYRYIFKTPTISCSFQGGKKAIDLAGEHNNVVVRVDCTPDNGKWKISYSTDSSAITVNADSGLVKGVSETTSARVKITATYNSRYTTTLTTDSIVVHKSAAAIKSVTLHSDGTQTYKVGDTIDRNGYYAVVNYDSGEPDNRNTDQNKLIVSFEDGSTTLKPEYVKYDGRSYFAIVNVKYTVGSTEYAAKKFEVSVNVPTPTFSLDTNSMTIDKGDSDYVGLSISNLTFAESKYTVEWSTSSSAVSLSNKSNTGVTVTGSSEGSATVTATLRYDGNVVASDSFTVTVEDTTTTTTTKTPEETSGYEPLNINDEDETHPLDGGYGY